MNSAAHETRETGMNANWSRLGTGMFMTRDDCYDLYVAGGRGDWDWNIYDRSQPNGSQKAASGNETTKAAAMAAAEDAVTVDAERDARAIYALYTR